MSKNLYIGYAKITSLAAASSAVGTDILPAFQSGDSEMKTLTLEQIITLVEAGGADGIITPKAITGADASLDITGIAGSAGAGGAVPIAGGAGDLTNVGGVASVTGGASGPGATGNGGATSVTGGAALSTNGSGGAGSVVGGVATGTGTGGAISITGGASAGASGTGGDVNIAAGAAAGGTVGAVNVAGSADTLGFHAVTAVVQASALTAAETTLTNAGTGGDSAIQAFTDTSPFGFVLAAEGEQVVETVLNNQARIAEIETVLSNLGLTA